MANGFVGQMNHTHKYLTEVYGVYNCVNMGCMKHTA